ncbi:hypothetical protein QQ045_019598 [Rhodiola kirilowii]
MATGRYGDYRDIKSKRRESDNMPRKEIECSKEEYDRVQNGDARMRDARGEVKVRQIDSEERLAVKSGYRASSSISVPGNGGSHREREDSVSKTVDREPGELSSESGSDDAADSGAPVKAKEVSEHGEAPKSENGPQLSAGRKRKFSPVVWDKDDKKFSKNTSIGVTSASPSLPPPPPRPKSLPQTPKMFSYNVVEVQSPKLEDDKLQVSESLPGKPSEAFSKENGESPDSGNLSSLPYHQEQCSIDVEAAHSEGIDLPPSEKQHWSVTQEAAHPEDDDFVPRNISSSRWADAVGSPRDVNEIAYNEGPRKRRKHKQTPRTESYEGNFNGISSARDPRKEGSVQDPSCLSDSDGNENKSSSSSQDNSVGSESEKCNIMDSDEENDYRGHVPGNSGSDSENQEVLHENQEPAAPPARSVNMLQACRSVDEFERLNKIDEGTYGVVYRARDNKSGEIVALKKVKMEREREGFPLTSLREINILLSFHHPSIVDVKEVVVGSSLDSIFMVMEYMEHDLKGLMETMKQPYSQSEVKCLMIQLLEGVKYLHDNWVLHRDLKTSNLLLNNRGELKICDFGLSRQYGSPLKPYTQLVVTLWYRAPELLLGAKQYSTAIDMWSLGCIMAELLSKKPLFDGKTEVEQLDKIFRTLGTPSEAIWPGFSKLPGVKVNFVKHQLSALGDTGLPSPQCENHSWPYSFFPLTTKVFIFRYNLLRKKFPATSFTGSPVLSDAGFNLLNKLLTYDPDKRITAEAALNHDWFREVPLPKSKDFMPTFPAQHAHDRRMRRVMKSPDPLEELRRRELQQGADLGNMGLFG